MGANASKFKQKSSDEDETTVEHHDDGVGDNVYRTRSTLHAEVGSSEGEDFTDQSQVFQDNTIYDVDDEIEQHDTSIAIKIPDIPMKKQPSLSKDDSIPDDEEGIGPHEVSIEMEVADAPTVVLPPFSEDTTVPRFVSRGRNPVDDPKAVSQALLTNRHRIVSRDGKLLPATNSIWQTIKEEYSFGKSARALHSFVSCNKHDIKIKLDLVVPKAAPQNNEDEEILSSSSSESNGDTDQSVSAPATRKFKLNISPEVWAQIKPEVHPYRRAKDSEHRQTLTRDYLVLKPGIWGDVIADLLYSVKKLPCSWSFKRNYISKTDEAKYWLKINGECMCSSTILITHASPAPPDPDRCGVELDVSIWGDGKKIDHDNIPRRRLAGKRRLETGREMVEKQLKATAVRKQKADELMNLFDPYPSHLPNNDVFRKAKSEALRYKRLHSDALQALLIMKYSHTHRFNLYDIGVDPFFIHFWTTNQMRLYNRYAERMYSRLIIDATGNVVQKMSRPAGEMSGHIFLYCGVVSIPGSGEGQVPVVQMLSERHNTPAITFWLTEWLRNGASVPNEVILDDSAALISACCRAFTGHSSSSSYMDACMRFIQGKSFEKPSSIIRLDVAHLTNLIRKWKEIACLQPKPKEFFIRCIILVAKAEELHSARKLLLALFITGLSPTEGMSIETGEPTACEIQKTWLKELIAKLPEADNEVGLPEVSEDAFEESSVVNEWIRDIYDEAKQHLENEVDGDRDNIMCCPIVLEKVKKLSYSLPIWCVAFARAMGSPFERGIGAFVESNFHILKNHLIKGLLRSDDFLFSYITFADGSVKIASTMDCVADEVRVSGASDADESEESEESGMKDSEGSDSRCSPVLKPESARNVAPSEECPEVHSFLTDAPLSLSCIACKDGNLPTGAHRCVHCDVAVHVFDGCSVTLASEDEGYGQKRCCLKCHEKNSHLRNDVPIPSKVSKSLTGSSSKTPGLQKPSESRPLCTICKNTSSEAIDSCIQCKKLVHTNDTCSTPLRAKRIGGKLRHLCTLCSPPTKSNNNAVNKELKEYENWRDKGRLPLKKRISSYWDDNPDFPLIPDKVQKTKIGVMKNGSSSKLKAVKLGKVQVTLRNTCSFDSPLHIFATAYSDSKDFRTAVHKQDIKGTIMEVAAHIATTGIQNKAYRLRAELLKDSLENSMLAGGLTEVNCLMSSSDLLQMVGVLPSCSETGSCNSPYCPLPVETRQVKVISAAESVIQTEGIRSLQRAVELASPCEDVECKRPFHDEDAEQVPSDYLIDDRELSEFTLCGGIRTIQREVRMQMVIDLPGQPQRHHTDKEDFGVMDCTTCYLKDIPPALTWGDTQLHLRGAVVFTAPTCDGDAGHYRAFCRRPDLKWEVYDDMVEKVYRPPRNTQFPISYLIYTV